MHEKRSWTTDTGRSPKESTLFSRVSRSSLGQMPSREWKVAEVIPNTQQVMTSPNTRKSSKMVAELTTRMSCSSREKKILIYHIWSHFDSIHFGSSGHLAQVFECVLHLVHSLRLFSLPLPCFPLMPAQRPSQQTTQQASFHPDQTQCTPEDVRCLMSQSVRTRRPSRTQALTTSAICRPSRPCVRA